MEVGNAKGSLVTCGGCWGGGASGTRITSPSDCIEPGMGAPVTGFAPAFEDTLWAAAGAASPDNIKTAKSLLIAK
jgi:hypothetical protein